MDVLEIVENIQMICDNRGIKPTVACRESGAGKDLLTNMKHKGTMPSLEKIRLLADYLGVTTSQLLGEIKEPAPAIEDRPDKNIVKIAGRDGSYYERVLTEDQQKMLKQLLEQLPPADNL